MANFGTERVYQEYEPVTRWTSEPDAEILVADLPGFKKEQLKVGVTAKRKVRLTGERPAGSNKWIRFHKETPIPLTVDIDSVSAMFKDDKLYIRHPKVKKESPQTKPPSPVIMKHGDEHDDGSKAKAEKQSDGENHHEDKKRAREAKDEEEKDKVGAKWFEKYREATGNAVKEAKNKRQLICNLAALVSSLMLIILYARNAVRSSSLTWKPDE